MAEVIDDRSDYVEMSPLEARSNVEQEIGRVMLSAVNLAGEIVRFAGGGLVPAERDVERFTGMSFWETPFVVLPAHEVGGVGRYGAAVCRRVASCLALGYISDRGRNGGKRRVPDLGAPRSPSPSMAFVDSYPISIGVAGADSLMTAGVTTVAGAELDVYEGPVDELAGEIPWLLCSGEGMPVNRKETDYWDVIKAYPPEAITREMIDSHRAKTAHFEALLAKVRDALYNPELNPRPARR